jgi:hypothetical protein
VTDVRTRGDRYQHLGELQNRDLALLRISGRLTNHYRISDRKPKDTTRLTLKAKVPVLVNIKASDNYKYWTRPVTCKGDSGAPLIDADGRLTAIASWRTGLRCGEGLSVFLRLASHRTWIEAQMEPDGNPFAVAPLNE